VNARPVNRDQPHSIAFQIMKMVKAADRTQFPRGIFRALARAVVTILD
jgi:hypothetical protein